MKARWHCLTLMAALLSALCWITLSLAQSPTSDKTVTVVLRDGSVFKGKLEVKTVEIETVYGRFNVPFEDVKAIRFGTKPDAAQNARMERLVTLLGDTDFKTREDAQKQLAELGWLAALQLEKAADSSDAEVATRVKALLDDLARAGEPPLREDEVDAKAFLIRGTVVATTFQVTTDNGVLKIARKNLLSITTHSATTDSGSTRFEVPNIGGDWGGSCSVLQNKGSLTFIYASREQTIAKFKDGTTIIYVSGAGSVNFPATVAPDARRINFYNGAAWSR